jgi:peptidyl-tRNA hydrolase, PTH1 family
MQLIVGLGNPGSTYAATRHNVGAWLVTALAEQYNITLHAEAKFHGLYGSIDVDGHELKLLLPTTFMNSSGQAVQAIASFYKIPLSSILVAHDELDFPAGEVRLRFNGGHGGHNGLKDIMQKVGSGDFYRLRIGIGHPGDKNKVHDYVLSKPRANEKKKIIYAIEKVMVLLPDLLNGDIDKVQRVLHVVSD